MDPNNKKDNEIDKWGLVALMVSFIAIIVAFLGTPLYSNLTGHVDPVKPSGYSIIRDIGPFPSDHLVIPIEWENSRQSSAIISKPTLILLQKDSNGNIIEKITFYMAGEYPDISTKAFNEEYAQAHSFILEPNSFTIKNIVFHVQDWWNERSSYNKFHFTGSGKTYEVTLVYYENMELKNKTDLFNLTLYDVDNLTSSINSNHTGYWYGYWSIDQWI